MDSGLIYAKTPIGDEAVRQSTRVVQRNLRMVLVQIDGKTTVQELSEKIGNQRLVESAIRDLEQGGFIVPNSEAAAAWAGDRPDRRRDQVSAISQFSSFGKQPTAGAPSLLPESRSSQFSSFGKPVFPAKAEPVSLPPIRRKSTEPPESDIVHGERKGPWGRLGLLAVFALLVVLVGAVFYPYDRLRPGIEQAAGQMLGVPVRIDSVSLDLLPVPQLVLSGVAAGIDESPHASEVRIDSLLGLALHGVQDVRSIVLRDARVNLAHLAALSAQKPLARGASPLKVRVQGMSIDAAPGLNLGRFNGQFEISGGALVSANLESPDRTLLLKLGSGSDGPAMSIEGRGWQLPGSPVVVDSLQATLEFGADHLRLRNIDALLLGGALKGAWRLNWANGLSMDGRATLARIDASRVASTLALPWRIEGDLDGTLDLLGRAERGELLWQGTTARLDAVMTRGALHGIDLGEAARRGRSGSVAGGSTRFDRLAGQVEISAAGSRMHNLMLDAGLLTATGNLDAAPGGRLDGSLLVAVSSSVSKLTLPFRVTGQLPNLQLSAGR